MWIYTMKAKIILNLFLWATFVTNGNTLEDGVAAATNKAAPVTDGFDLELEELLDIDGLDESQLREDAAFFLTSLSSSVGNPSEFSFGVEAPQPTTKTESCTSLPPAVLKEAAPKVDDSVTIEFSLKYAVPLHGKPNLHSKRRPTAEGGYIIDMYEPPTYHGDIRNTRFTNVQNLWDKFFIVQKHVLANPTQNIWVFFDVDENLLVLQDNGHTGTDKNFSVMATQPKLRCFFEAFQSLKVEIKFISCGCGTKQKLEAAKVSISPSATILENLWTDDPILNSVIKGHHLGLYLDSLPTENHPDHIFFSDNCIGSSYLLSFESECGARNIPYTTFHTTGHIFRHYSQYLARYDFNLDRARAATNYSTDHQKYVFSNVYDGHPCFGGVSLKSHADYLKKLSDIKMHKKLTVASSSGSGSSAAGAGSSATSAPAPLLENILLLEVGGGELKRTEVIEPLEKKGIEKDVAKLSSTQIVRTVSGVAPKKRVRVREDESAMTEVAPSDKR